MYKFGSLALVALMGTTAQADVIQLGVNTDVAQTFFYNGPTPNEAYTHPNEVTDYPFFQQYVESVYEAGLWTESELNLSLDYAPQEITSFGRLEAIWTFDDVALAQDLTGYTDQDGTVIGSYDLNSTFQITTQLGDKDSTVSNGVNVLAVNNMDVGDGQMLDVIGIQALLPPTNPDEDNFGVLLMLSGGSNWFEDAATSGEKLDLTTLERAAVMYELQHFEDRADDYVLYSVEINGEVGRDQMKYRNFGAADGSSEDAPLLPEVIESNEDGAPSFSFDLSDVDTDSQMVFIDPEIAVGYTYTLDGGKEISAIQAPTLAAVDDADGYLVTLPNGTTFRIQPGEIKVLDAPVTSFTLSDIDPLLGLDPLDQTTFVLGMQLSGQGDAFLTQTAIVIDTDTPAVPLPAGIVLLASGVAGLGFARRLRKAA
ncbi:VPLPA-CTERM sorting domain-containing protein [Pseudooceanicola onchidii]|uniref:VPLPA-CTERM sorting domain-containing protein n=1 Tax=Pseudooceanicola onchidii TaxID=2562279 RepID=UPI0010AAD9BE|nr:VPLPA-CTERM sorting domain-containing protein [Pseudooceanicola onchidii]